MPDTKAPKVRLLFQPLWLGNGSVNDGLHICRIMSRAVEHLIICTKESTIT